MRRCVTVTYGRVKGSAKKYPYYQAATYYEHVTKDGRSVWWLENVIAGTFRSRDLAVKHAKDKAVEHGIPYLENIRQNTPISS
jgi:hypothetical protein